MHTNAPNIKVNYQYTSSCIDNQITCIHIKLCEIICLCYVIHHKQFFKHTYEVKSKDKVRRKKDFMVKLVQVSEGNKIGANHINT